MEARDKWLAERSLKKHGRTREQRIHRIATYRADKHRRKEEVQRRRRPLQKSKRNSRPHQIIAYDLETTRIKAGTPEVRYITAFGERFRFSERVDSEEQLGLFLRNCFLTEDNKGARFIAWNGNSFDVFFIARALLPHDQYLIRPYLTANKSLRGLKIIDRESGGQWEFLDGISMILGGNKDTLKKFLETFAPEFGKLEGPNFEHEEFDPDNAKHVAYAERDSEGLYHGILKAQGIIEEFFEQQLQPTIGNLGIRIFQQEMPEGVRVWAMNHEAESIMREYVMRGGYCYINRKYHGPVWKYDINQAYAAAMREAKLPCGRMYRLTRFDKDHDCAIYRVNAHKVTNKVPFYCADSSKRKVFKESALDSVWITSIEYRQLRDEGWNIVILEGFAWREHFNMKGMVDKLERLRVHAPGGPKSAQGAMMKAVGNNAYGKTVEQLDGLELVMSMEKPDGFHEYQNAEETLPFIWFKMGDPLLREYHQPQIGAFITAHVRMVLRRAILLNPEAWIYADTDGLAFTEPVAVDIDAGRYGAWKVECEGEVYKYINKKVYVSDNFKEKKAKGLNVRNITQEQFNDWFDGKPPKQEQVQRINFLKFLGGAEMFRSLTKWGEVNGYTKDQDGKVGNPEGFPGSTAPKRRSMRTEARGR